MKMDRLAILGSPESVCGIYNSLYLFGQTQFDRTCHFSLSLAKNGTEVRLVSPVPIGQTSLLVSDSDLWGNELERSSMG